jgi:hypothetical protein
MYTIQTFGFYSTFSVHQGPRTVKHHIFYSHTNEKPLLFARCNNTVQTCTQTYAHIGKYLGVRFAFEFLAFSMARHVPPKANLFEHNYYYYYYYYSVFVGASNTYRCTIEYERIVSKDGENNISR